MSAEDSHHAMQTAAPELGKDSPPRSVHNPLAAVRQLARKLEGLHQLGQLHLRITFQTVTWNDEGQLLLPPPPEAVTFGGEYFEEETCPFALRTSNPIIIPSQLPAARQVLAAAQLSFPPEAIDLYQLSALLCRLLTGQPISSYLRSPKTKSQVPPAVQDVIERGLRHEENRAFQNLTEFAEALTHIDSAAEKKPLSLSPPSTEDTAPSVLSPKPECDTSLANPPKRDSTSSERDISFKRLGHFEILERIGHGGMGDVYKGYERSLDRTVAIKVLPAELSRSDDFVRRFYAEATAAARLVHPNIIQIYYIGEDQNCHFFAMQFVQGESLADRLAARGKLSLEETLKIIEQSLSGLTAAHELGLIHRDIKPGNILLDAKTQRAYLADFGLVKSLQEGAGLTATGMVMGTVDYISPEQGRGLPVDARADLYSLGVVIYRMLSGRLPFEADSPTAMIFQHVYETPPPLNEIVGTVPASYAQIVGKLLAKKPQDRYASSDDVLLDLKAAQNQKPLPSGADIITWDDPADFASSSKKLKPPFGLEATVLIQSPRFDDDSAISEKIDDVAPIGWWGRLRNHALDLLSEQAPDLYQKLQSTQQQVDGAVANYQRRKNDLDQLAIEAESVLETLQQQLADWKIAAKNAQERLRDQSSADGFGEAEAEQQRCGQAIATIEEQISQQQKQLDAILAQRNQVQARLQQIRVQRDLLSARLKVARARLEVAGGRRMPAPKLRRVLAWASRHRWKMLLGLLGVFCLIAFAIVSKNPQLETLLQPNSLRVPADEGSEAVQLLRPQGVYYASDYPQIQSRLPLRQLFHKDVSYRVVKFSPDNRLLATAGGPGIRIWNVETGEKLQEFPNSGNIWRMAFSPDGQKLVSGDNVRGNASGTVRVWNVAEGRETKTLSGPNGTVYDLKWSADGEYIVGLVSRQSGFFVVAWSAEGFSQHESSPLPHTCTGMTTLSENANVMYFSQEKLAEPDTLTLVNSVQILNLAAPEQLLGNVFEVKESVPVEPGQTDPMNRECIGLSTISSNGKWCAARVGRSGTVLVWNLETQQLHATLKGMGAQVDSLAFSQDEKRLAVGVAQASAADPPGVYVWDLESVRLGAKVQTTTAPRKMEFSLNGRFLVTESDRTNYLLFDATLQPEEIAQPAEEFASGTLSTLSQKGNILLVASGNHVTQYAMPTGKLVRTLDFDDDVVLLAIPDDEQFFVVGTNEGVLTTWKVRGGSKIREINLSSQLNRRLEPNRSMFDDIAIAPDNQHVLVTSSWGSLLWNVATGEEKLNFLSDADEFYQVAISADGRFVATLGQTPSSGKHHLRIWDYARGEMLHEFTNEAKNVHSLEFSPEGATLICGGTGRLLAWSPDSADALRPIDIRQPGKTVNGFAFFPSGKQLALAIDNSIHIWDLEVDEDRLLLSLGPRFRYPVRSLCITPDSRRIIASYKRGSTLIWDLQSGGRKGVGMESER